MADSTLNAFVARGTNAQRVAFTPSPPTPASGNSPGYFFYETDTGNTYTWDGSAWDQVNTSNIQTLLDGISTTQGVILYYNGTDWVALATGTAGRKLQTNGAGANPSWTSETRSIVLAIDGGGSAITTGVKADVYVPYACTITAVTMLADQSGSIVVDIWKDTYANYPPTGADSITASAKPTISSATKSQDNTLTGWTTSVSAGDTLRFNVDSATTVTRLHLALTVTVP